MPVGPPAFKSRRSSSGSVGLTTTSAAGSSARGPRHRPVGMTICTHLCRGNFKSAWVAEGGYEQGCKIKEEGRPGESVFRSSDEVPGTSHERRQEHERGCAEDNGASDQVVAAIGVDFVDALSAADVEAIVATIEDKVRTALPQIVLLLVKPQSLTGSARPPRVHSQTPR